jgi:hypothetical protein
MTIRPINEQGSRRARAILILMPRTAEAFTDGDPIDSQIVVFAAGLGGAWMLSGRTGAR